MKLARWDGRSEFCELFNGPILEKKMDSCLQGNDVLRELKPLVITAVCPGYPAEGKWRRLFRHKCFNPGMKKTASEEGALPNPSIQYGQGWLSFFTRGEC
jgi:hypothetical protein